MADDSPNYSVSGSTTGRPGCTSNVRDGERIEPAHALHIRVRRLRPAVVTLTGVAIMKNTMMMMMMMMMMMAMMSVGAN